MEGLELSVFPLTSRERIETKVVLNLQSMIWSICLYNEISIETQKDGL